MNMFALHIAIRDKLNFVVPVLLGSLAQKYLALIIKNRTRAGIEKKNLNFFGLINTLNSTVHRHRRTIDLMRKFSEKYGAKKPGTLRSITFLATKSVIFGMKEN